MSQLNQKPSLVTLIKEYFLITVGLTLYALGWAMFLTPNGMIGGGVTGFAAILQYATNGAIPISITYFVLNIILLIVGTKILGTGFGAKTIYVEVYDRIDAHTLTGKLVYPITDKFIVQWEEMLDLYP